MNEANSLFEILLTKEKTIVPQEKKNDEKYLRQTSRETNFSLLVYRNGEIKIFKFSENKSSATQRNLRLKNV